MKPLHIAWLAGVVEGEGHINFRRGSPTIRVSMTDFDIIQRIAGMWKVRISGPYKPRGNQTKDVWTVSVHGYSAIGWLMTLFTFLGNRRRATAAAAIAAWNAAPGFARKVRGPNGMVLSANCHPERPLHARQMCRQCYSHVYMKTWRTKTGRNSSFYRDRAKLA